MIHIFTYYCCSVLSEHILYPSMGSSAIAMTSVVQNQTVVSWSMSLIGSYTWKCVLDGIEEAGPERAGAATPQHQRFPVKLKSNPYP